MIPNEEFTVQIQKNDIFYYTKVSSVCCTVLKSTYLYWFMPLYQDIADHIVKLVRLGHYSPGEKLPSIRALAKQQQVSIATVQKAFEQLEDSGLIEPRPKSGFYVRMPIDSDDDSAETFQHQMVPLRPEQVKIHERANNVFHQCDSPDVVNLGTSYPAPCFYPTKQLKKIGAQVVKHQMESVLEVHFSPGVERLRKCLAKRLTAAGCTIGADELIITNGCLEAMSICLRAVANPGDTIAIESPVFVGLLQLIESMGYRALEIPCYPGKGMSLHALELALEQWDIKAVAIVPTFSNPSGSNMPEANRRDLVSMLAKKSIPLIEDDLFVDLAFDGAIYKPCKAFDEKGLVLYCSSASKAVASGFRIGWIAPGAYYHQVEYFKTFTNISAPNFSQMVLAEFLESGGYDRHLRQLRTALAKQMYKIQQYIAAYFPSDTTVSHPQGGCVLWVGLGEQIDAFEFQHLAINEGIGIIPGPLFTTSGKFDHHVRINCACDPDLPLEQAVRTLGNIALKLKEKC